MNSDKCTIAIDIPEWSAHRRTRALQNSKVLMNIGSTINANKQ